MTKWKSLGKNGKEGEHTHTQKKKNGSANTLKQHVLSRCSQKQVRKLESRPFKE